MILINSPERSAFFFLRDINFFMELSSSLLPDFNEMTKIKMTTFKVYFICSAPKAV